MLKKRQEFGKAGAGELPDLPMPVTPADPSSKPAAADGQSADQPQPASSEKQPAPKADLPGPPTGPPAPNDDVA